MTYEVRQAYAGTVLGISWAALQPLLFLGTYLFLFTVLRVQTTSPEGTLGRVGVFMTGLVPWLYFIRSFSRGLGSLSSRSALVKQINFPVDVIPFVTVGVLLIDFSVGLGMLLILSVWQGWASWALLMFIPAVLLLTGTFTAMAALVAPVGVMLKEIRNFLPIIIRLGLFLSPVLYLPATLPSRVEWLAYVNPLSYLIDLVRYATFGRTDVLLLTPLQNLVIAAGLTVGLGVLAYLRRGYARRVVDYL